MLLLRLIPLAVVLSVTASPTLYASTIKAEIDRERIYLDESVNLILSMEGDSDNVSGNPDLTELEKDFDVLSESTQTNIRIQNGVSKVVRNWIFGIRPKRTGMIEIPSISIGRFKSNPVQLEVEEFQGNISKVGADLFLEFESTPRNPYVQSQVILTIRLFTAVAISHGRLSDPIANFAAMQQLGQDRRYESKRGDRNYDVIEKRFAVFPEQSGTHEIPSVEFSGIVSRYSSSTMQTEYSRERISSEPVVLKVRPKPSGYSGKTWLPTSDLELSDSWSGRLPDFEIGKPEDRKISIKAVGLRAVQLSSPDYEPNKSVRIYSNSPELNTLQTARATVAQRDEEFVIIPDTSENVTIPEFRVVWWDIDEDREKVAVLPELTTAQVTALSSAAATGDLMEDADVLPASAESSPVNSESAPTWMWVSFGMLIMWLMTLAVWYLSRRNPVADHANEVWERDQNALTIRRSLTNIKKACRDNDVSRVSIGMLDLAKLWWPDRPPRNLIELGLRTGDEEFQLELRNLDLILYSGDSREWDGDRFWQQLRNVCKTVRGSLKKQSRRFFFRKKVQPPEDLWFDSDFSTD